MTEIMENAGMVCGVLLGTELISRLCPKDKAVSFVRALAALVLIASTVAAFAGMRWDLPELRQGTAENPALSEYLEGEYQAAARQDWERYIQGLLGAAGMQAKKITVETDITEENRIVLTRAEARFDYESDARRAEALLRNALGPDVVLEVAAGGA